MGPYLWRSTTGQIGCAAPMSEVPWTVVFAEEAIIAEADLLANANSLATAPLRGESRDDLLPGLRHLALDRAVYWFRPRAEQREIQVLAVFLG